MTLVQSIAYNRCIQTLDLSGMRIRKPFLKSHFEPALKSNITLKYVLGKLTPDIIDEDLNINITIENQVLPHLMLKAKFKKGDFNTKCVDSENTSILQLTDLPNSLFEPALKFVKYHSIRICDFSGMGL